MLVAGSQPNELQVIPEEEDERAYTQGTDNIQAQTHAGGMGCKAGAACSQLVRNPVTHTHSRISTKSCVSALRYRWEQAEVGLH